MSNDASYINTAPSRCNEAWESEFRYVAAMMAKVISDQYFPNLRSRARSFNVLDVVYQGCPTFLPKGHIVKPLWPGGPTSQGIWNPKQNVLPGGTNYLELGRGYVAAPRAVPCFTHALFASRQPPPLSVKSVCNYFTSFNTHTPPNEYGSFYVKSAGLLGSQNLYLFHISNACKQIWLFWQQGGPHKTDSRAGFGPRAVGWAALLYTNLC
ncbi:hypothetical protein J6590_014034 [Homalodisca vitripennis]|nr:hypothetical protein J6590_014034 [Homalodisca vitripennis]